MPNIIVFEILTIIICLVVAVISLILYLGEYKRRSDQFESPFQKISSSEENSLNLIHRAIKKAQNIIGNAELAGIKIEAEDKLKSKKIEEGLEKELTVQMAKIFDEYQRYLESLKTKDNEVQILNQEYFKQRVNNVFERFEQSLATFLTSTEQKSLSSIELELKSARQLIETYKTTQMKIIDENIVAVLERTLALVISKKIPLKDQVDLVYEALEKAKSEKLIV